jgi:hypothetical protein
MKSNPSPRWRLVLMSMSSAAMLGACADNDDDFSLVEAPPVTIEAIGTANTVSRFDEIAATTINQPNAASGTPEERQSNYAFDLATVHVAMYDAVIAIAGDYQPFYATAPVAPGAGASQDAAAMAAAYGVLRALFPSRTTFYQAAYDSALAGIANGDSKTRGVALGAEVAATVVAARANDGRAVVLAPFVAGTAPGAFRGPAIVGRTSPFVRPFAMTSASQFRTPAPQALSSAGYATDLNETQSLGGTLSSVRTTDQGVMARFHTESPATLWPRNLRRFTMTSRSLADQARLGALLWVTHADATIACFESKYTYLAWRPFSAINLADTDNNSATTADPAWTPFLPTPPHPEYPGAHGCASGAAAEALRAFYNTKSVAFDFDSTASGTTRRYASTDALVDEITLARIYGGMHFRSSMLAGETLGTSVSRYTVQNRFRPK